MSPVPSEGSSNHGFGGSDVSGGCRSCRTAVDVRKEMFQTVQASVVTKQVCRQPLMQPFLEAGGTYLYRYSDKAGEIFGEFTISQENCRK